MTLEMFDKQVKTVGMLINSILKEVILYNTEEREDNPLLVCEVSTISVDNPYIAISFEALQRPGHRYHLNIFYDGRAGSIFYGYTKHRLELISDYNYREIPTPEIVEVANKIAKDFFCKVENTPVIPLGRWDRIQGFPMILEEVGCESTDYCEEEGFIESEDFHK